MRETNHVGRKYFILIEHTVDWLQAWTLQLLQGSGMPANDIDPKPNSLDGLGFAK
jgi:hypothetical protein